MTVECVLAGLLKKKKRSPLSIEVLVDRSTIYCSCVPGRYYNRLHHIAQRAGKSINGIVSMMPAHGTASLGGGGGMDGVFCFFF